MNLYSSNFKFSILIFLLGILYPPTLFSQDTIFVYETIYLTDTIWVEKEKETFDIHSIKTIPEAILEIDSNQMQANLIINSLQKTATIPINHILLSEDNHQTLRHMKRLTFLGLTLLTMNSAFGQVEFNNTLGFFVKGNTQYQLIHYYEMDQYFPDELYLDHQGYSITPSFGFVSKLDLTSNIFLSPKLFYTKKRPLTPNHRMYAVNSEIGYEVGQYKGTNKSKFHFIGTDLLINYDFHSPAIKPLRIYSGPRIEYLIHNSLKDEEMNPNYTDLNRLNFDFVAGIGIDFYQRFYFELEFSQSLNRFVDTEEIWIKYRSISASLGCYIF